MAFRDLRDALEWIRGRGCLLEVEEELACRFEVSAFLGVVSRRLEKAVLFRRVSGHAVPVVGNLTFSRGVIAAGMGVAPEGLVDAFRARSGGRVEPRTVSAAEAPLLESSAGTVDLARDLPLLTHYAEDSGPYITSGLVSARDPDTGAIARGIHRMELRGKDCLGAALLNPPLGEIYAKVKARGQKLPLAVTVGLEPLTFLGAAQGAPIGKDKLSVAGALRGEPVEVAAAPLTGIPVPARAEFLLEGELDPRDERQDGPLGESSGYYMAFPRTPTFHVQAIAHRRDPIYHAVVPTGRDVDLLMSVVGEAATVPVLRDQFPFVTEYQVVPGTFGTSVVVKVAETGKSYVRSLLTHLLSLSRVKKALAVADDVDASDLAELEWCLATRCQPDGDVILLGDLRGTPIDPSCPEPFRTAKIGIDATGFGRLTGQKRAGFPPEALERARSVLAGFPDG